MAARKLRPKPSKGEEPSSKAHEEESPTVANGDSTPPPQASDRYRPLPTGMHGLDPELVKSDQRERLRNAMVELIAAKGYQAVRIIDLARLARVSQPTFYSLFGDKEELFVSAYDEIAERVAGTAITAYSSEGSEGRGRLQAAIRAFTELAAAEPEAISLLVLGAFGAGARALEHRKRSLEALESRIRASRDGDPASDSTDLTVKVILGGIREVTAIRLVREREDQLPGLADELSAWASCYPRRVPPELAAPPATPRSGPAGPAPTSERARRAEGRLPSGRSDLPREAIVASQSERIVDATAAIVAEKGLAALTIPEIARRASVSHQTFYDIYPSKHDAFVGAQKVGMMQALRMGVEAWEAEMPDWPRAIAAGLRAVVDYIASEPAHAHLSIVDTFGASPETIETRDEILRGFATYFNPGYDLAPKGVEVPAVAAEAGVGGCWQVLHHYVENDRIAELPGAAPQLTYMLLTPFLGPTEAARVALLPVGGGEGAPQAAGEASA
jgi:AcrR family transcriptional regulator